MTDKLSENMNDDFKRDKSAQMLLETYRRESSELPPQSIDADILNAAHQALESDSVEKENTLHVVKKTSKRWYVPVSYVAVLVLSLSVMMKLAFEPELSIAPSAEYDRDGLFEGEKLQQTDSTELAREIFQPKNKYQSEYSQERQARESVIRQRKEQQSMRQMPRMSQPAKRKMMKSPQADVSSASSSMIDNDRSVMPSAVAAFPALADEAINVKQSRVDELMVLYKHQQFDELRVALQQFHQDYPSDNNENMLPQVLQNWARQNKMAE